MKYIIIILSLLSLTINTFCQTENDSLNVYELDSVPALFNDIVKNHIKTMKRRGVRNAENNIIVLNILPTISRRQHVPQKTIDSIYSNNFFPSKDINTPEYAIIANTLHKSSISEIEKGLTISDTVFYFKYLKWDIYIYSTHLNINFITTKKEKKISIKIKNRSKKIISYLSNYYTRYNFFGDCKYGIILKDESLNLKNRRYYGRVKRCVSKSI